MSEAKASRGGEARFYLIAILVGLGTGAIGTAFHLGVDAILAWPAALTDALGKGTAVYVAAAISAVMVTLSLFLVRRFAPEAAGSGVQEIEGALAGERVLRWHRVLPVKFFAGLLSLGAGLVVGREGPTIHMGASVAGGFASWVRLDKLETNGLMAAGAAAGLATAFNAPLAAMLFVIEETRTQFRYSFRTYMGVLIASVAATIVTEEIAGVGPNLEIMAEAVPLWMLVGFLGLGAVLGAFGVVFNMALIASLNAAGALAKRVPYLFPLLFGGAMGACTILVPPAAFGGETLITELVQEQAALLMLFGFVLLRFFTTLGSYATGVPGGIFAPILALATCVGLALGAAFETLIPAAEGAPKAFAIAAMGGLFSASVRAPLVGVVLTLELTGAYELLLPTLITCGMANLVAEWLGGRPIYEQLLERTLRLAGVEHKASPEREEHVPVELGWEDRREDGATQPDQRLDVRLRK